MSDPNGGFMITCPRCWDTNVEVSSFQVVSGLSYTGTVSFPMLSCQRCGYEWNPTMRPSPEIFNHEDNDESGIL